MGSGEVGDHRERDRSDDARRQEFCNVPRYDGTYQNYPEIHLGNLIQECELMLRRSDSSFVDNVEGTDIPESLYAASDGSTKTPHLYPGRGSLERAINAIIIDAATSWRRPGALRVAYHYYWRNKRLPGSDLALWAAHLTDGATCRQDICFGTLTHALAHEENPGLPPDTAPPGEENR